MMTSYKTYSELIELDSFEKRFEYLKLDGSVGKDTFGYDRYLNQQFYRSAIWKKIRNEIILRDNGCDLGIEGHDIFGKVFIHHMNPVDVSDVLDQSEILLNPEFLICVSQLTHNAIHYGSFELLPKDHQERTPFDTCPWRKT